MPHTLEGIEPWGTWLKPNTFPETLTADSENTVILNSKLQLVIWLLDGYNFSFPFMFKIGLQSGFLLNIWQISSEGLKCIPGVWNR
jgi:hypothetical protein